MARDQVYAFDGPAACMPGRMTDLTAAYQKAAKVIVPTQLERAGVRLATELNRALSSPELSGRTSPLSLGLGIVRALETWPGLLERLPLSPLQRRQLTDRWDRLNLVAEVLSPAAPALDPPAKRD